MSVEFPKPKSERENTPNPEIGELELAAGVLAEKMRARGLEKQEEFGGPELRDVLKDIDALNLGEEA